jgi:hypothetical protein
MTMVVPGGPKVGLTLAMTGAAMATVVGGQ